MTNEAILKLHRDTLATTPRDAHGNAICHPTKPDFYGRTLAWNVARHYYYSALK